MYNINDVIYQAKYVLSNKCWDLRAWCNELIMSELWDTLI